MCDDNKDYNWCDGTKCTSGTDCYTNFCNNGECDTVEIDAGGLAAGIIVLIIICVVIPCCAIIGCVVCCVMGVGFCAKKGAEAAAAQ